MTNLRDKRCGRCLVVVPPDTFMHDCSGQGLDADHYVKRLEVELERLGTWLTKQGYEPELREAAVDAAIRIIGILGTTKGEKCQRCGAEIYDPARDGFRPPAYNAGGCLCPGLPTKA